MNWWHRRVIVQGYGGGDEPSSNMFTHGWAVWGNRSVYQQRNTLFLGRRAD